MRRGLLGAANGEAVGDVDVRSVEVSCTVISVGGIVKFQGVLCG